MGNEKKLINMSKIVVNIAIYIYIYIYIYSRIMCQIYTHSKKNLRNDFILFVCCYVPSTILIEVCTLQIKSLSSKF